MQIKGFMEWVNETLLNEIEIQLKPTGIKKDFAGNANTPGGAEEFFKKFTVPYRDTDGIERTYVKQVGQAYFANVAFTRRYLQADQKNVMEFNYAIGDQLIPVKEVDAKLGGVIKPATQSEIAAYTTAKTNQAAAQASNPNKEAGFSFSFDSGKYLQDSITPDQLAKLTADLQPILTELKTPKFMDGKTIIAITASTSNSGVGQVTLAGLKTAGFEPTDLIKFKGNDALCAARLDTMKKVIISIFTKALNTSEAELVKKVDIQQVSKPSQGAGTEFQYIKASITQTGTKIPDGQKLVCNTILKVEGIKGTSSNNYCGYRKDLFIMTEPGKSIDIEFNPKNIPDMVFIKYGEKEFLSTWLGVPGENSISYVNNLNQIPELEAKINAELTACGSTGTVASLSPTAKVGGKWVVRPGKEQKNGISNTYTFPLGEKTFNKDKLIVRCFSPLSGTVFSITAKCSPS